MDELRDVQNEESIEAAGGSGQTRKRRYVRPTIDVFSTETEMVVLADMPGARKADVEITIDGDDLIVEAAAAGRREEESGLPWGYHRRFKLRSAFDRNKISATLAHGILRVTLPKTARAKPKKVKVG